jgi:hypothetical protein
MAYAFCFNVVEVTSQKWKKHFQLLNTDSIIAKKEEMSQLRKKGKTLKDKTDKKSNSKEIEKFYKRPYKNYEETKMKLYKMF